MRAVLFALCRVVCSAGRCTELLLLKVHQLSFFVGTSVDLDATEQRQDTKTGVLQAIKRSQQRQIQCYLAGCLPTVRHHMPGRANSLALAQALRMFPCRLFAYSASPYAGPGE